MDLVDKTDLLIIPTSSFLHLYHFYIPWLLCSDLSVWNHLDIYSKVRRTIVCMCNPDSRLEQS